VSISREHPQYVAGRRRGGFGGRHWLVHGGGGRRGLHPHHDEHHRHDDHEYDDEQYVHDVDHVLYASTMSGGAMHAGNTGKHDHDLDDGPRYDFQYNVRPVDDYVHDESCDLDVDCSCHVLDYASDDDYNTRAFDHDVDLYPYADHDDQHAP
jgi:hypothetical protein